MQNDYTHPLEAVSDAPEQMELTYTEYKSTTCQNCPRPIWKEGSWGKWCEEHERKYEDMANDYIYESVL